MSSKETLPQASKALGYRESIQIRRHETNDIVKRLSVISKKNIYLKDLPSEEVLTVFNPAIMIRQDNVFLYPRVVLGYFLYVSAIAETKIPLADILDGKTRDKRYPARLVVSPSNQYDIWGSEDPRVYLLGDKVAMTYTGRTKFYFKREKRTQKAFPVTAILKCENGRCAWEKRYVHVPVDSLRRSLISDKDAYLYKVRDEYYLFHRPHYKGDNFYVFISKTEKIDCAVNKEVQELVYRESISVTEKAPFETKIGWATPPICLGGNEIIAFIHGVDNVIEAYRLFAIHLELGKDGVVVKAVTPRYIMEPREKYEIFGDRPYTIFPCGLWPLSRDEYLISYGAGDYVSGIGLLKLTDLLAELDKGRIY